MAKTSAVKDYSEDRRYEYGAVAELFLKNDDISGAKKSLDKLVLGLGLPAKDIQALLDGVNASETSVKVAGMTYAAQDRVARFGLDVGEIPLFYEAEFGNMFSDDERKNQARTIFKKYEGKTWADLEKEAETLNGKMKEIQKYRDPTDKTIKDDVRKIKDELEALSPVLTLISRMNTRHVQSLYEPLAEEAEVEDNDSIAKRYGTPTKD